MVRYVPSELLPNTNVAVRISFSCQPYSGLASNVRVGSYSARLSPLTRLLRRERSRFSILVDSDKRKGSLRDLVSCLVRPTPPPGLNANRH